MANELQSTSVMQRDLTFHFLERITNKFSTDRIIGYGTYGVVYKGVLDNGEEVAVKRLKHLGIDDDKQFKNECTNLMMLQHENIVRLIGYCYEISHKLEKYKGQFVYAGVEEKVLCFEYLQGGSLDRHLSDESCGHGWHTRYNIIKGICEGLHYLHNGSKDPIYHLDLKPANILLDKNMVPKIGDFGLSRLFDSTQTCTTKGILGTPYQITPKFDVFSLGVIIIQIMTGREGYTKCGDVLSQEFIALVHENWAKRLQSTMSSHTSHEIKTCMEIALRCVETDRVKRPTIADIVDELNKIDIVKRSLLDQVNLQSSQASNRHTNSGAGADAESRLTTSSSPIIQYGDEGTSTGTKEQERKTLQQNELEEDPSKCYETHDPGRQSESILQSLPPDVRRDIKRHLCLGLIRQVPFFSQMDNQLLVAICEHLVSSLCTKGTYIFREGDPVTEMLFIIRGKLESSTTNGGCTGFFNLATLKPGDFCGEELLGWALVPEPTNNLPPSSRTVKALVDVEAFALQAEDLKSVASQFRRLRSKKFQHTYRYYSLQWRTWAACFIQAAWRRYKRRKMVMAARLIQAAWRQYKSNMATDPSMRKSFHSVRLNEVDYEDDSPPKNSLTVKSIHMTWKAPQNIEELPNLRKPDEPDFSAEPDD